MYCLTTLIELCCRCIIGSFIFAGAEEIKDSTIDRTTSTASKAFNESRPHRLRHLMSLALPEPIKMPFGLRTSVGPENHVLDGMPFGLWARMGPRNHVLDGVQIPMGRAILGETGANCKV